MATPKSRNKPEPSETETWARVINDSRWYDGLPENLLKLINHFKSLNLQLIRVEPPESKQPDFTDLKREYNIESYGGITEYKRKKLWEWFVSKITPLQRENEYLKIELSNYAYQIGVAKRERDKAEQESIQFREALKRALNDFTKGTWTEETYKVIESLLSKNHSQGKEEAIVTRVTKEKL